MDSELQEKINEWLEFDKNLATRDEIQRLVTENKYDDLRSRLMKRMEFGTAGLRSKMGAGYSMMNNLTIIQTGQGFLEYLKKFFGQKLNNSGIVIGYDARHNSKTFAYLTANIFLNAGIRVYLFRQIVPTPFVPFSILKYKCCAGVMVTASHNPKEDNGYKVYFENGSQIISPHDKGIASCITENLKPRLESWRTENVENNVLRTEPFDEVYQDYFGCLKKMCNHGKLNAATPLRFTYTAMHGVGYEFSVESFKSFDHVPFFSVKEQIQPDPDFPTVTFPNPEEGKSALTLAIKTANENDSTIILANDPDADRLAVAEKNRHSDDWRVFNGNEIGALFGWWIWHCYKEKNKAQLEAQPDIAQNVYMLYSTVSSQILRSIAEKEGFSCEDTLTGFKWMGNRADYLINTENKEVIFCFEEAIGFLCSSKVLDKDGISAEAIMAEMAVYLESVEKRNLAEQLDWIYNKYGYHVSNNSYYLCYEKENIDKMFYKLRHYKDFNNEEVSYPETLGPYKIDKIRDLTEGLNVDFKNGGVRSKPTFPCSKSSHMITFYFENGCIVTIRTSGTEPKVKWYSEIRQLDMSKSREQVKSELDDLVQRMIEDFYQPEANNFKARSS